MVYWDGHELALVTTVAGAFGVTHGIFGKGWMKSLIHRQPILAMSLVLSVTGMTLPLVVVPIRRKLGLPTNQYDHHREGTVFPKLIE